MTPPLDPAYRHEVESLRIHVDTKFESVQEWVARVSVAIEKLADQRDRIIVLEQNVGQLNTALTSVVENHKELAGKVEAQGTKLIKYVAYISLIGGAFAIIAPIIIPIWIN